MMELARSLRDGKVLAWKDPISRNLTATGELFYVPSSPVEFSILDC